MFLRARREQQASEGQTYKKGIDQEYELGKEIGSGQFAVVRNCIQKSTRKSFAAKSIRKKAAKSSRRGLFRVDIVREVNILKKLDHESIMKIYDVYEDRMRVILVIELISGGELFDYLSEKETLTEVETACIIKQVLIAAGYLHSKKVAHLDLKPENIMLLDRNAATPKIKLIDFGLSQVIRPGQQCQAVHGTPEFVAPEILNYEPVSFPADIWSIGVITYILLSGCSPFLGDDKSETFDRIIECDYDFDDEIFEGVSDEAKIFISDILDRNPRARPTAKGCIKKYAWVNLTPEDPSGQETLAQIETQSTSTEPSTISYESYTEPDSFNNTSRGESRLSTITNMTDKTDESEQEMENDLENQRDLTKLLENKENQNFSQGAYMDTINHQMKEDMIVVPSDVFMTPPESPEKKCYQANSPEKRDSPERLPKSISIHSFSDSGEETIGNVPQEDASSSASMISVCSNESKSTQKSDNDEDERINEHDENNDNKDDLPYQISTLSTPPPGHSPETQIRSHSIKSPPPNQNNNGEPNKELKITCPRIKVHQLRFHSLIPEIKSNQKKLYATHRRMVEELENIFQNDDNYKKLKKFLQPEFQDLPSSPDKEDPNNSGSKSDSEIDISRNFGSLGPLVRSGSKHNLQNLSILKHQAIRNELTNGENDLVILRKKFRDQSQINRKKAKQFCEKLNSSQLTEKIHSRNERLKKLMEEARVQLQLQKDNLEETREMNTKLAEDLETDILFSRIMPTTSNNKDRSDNLANTLKNLPLLDNEDNQTLTYNDSVADMMPKSLLNLSRKSTDPDFGLLPNSRSDSDLSNFSGSTATLNAFSEE